MRTDVTIDRRQIKYLPNASHLGYDKWRAQVGDVLTWKYPGDDASCYGRMIGRVVYAPACGETPAIKNWILVLELTIGLSHVGERWIDPAWVLQCQDARGFAAWMAYFFGSDLPTGKDARYLANYGSLGCAHADTFGPVSKGQTHAEYNRAILDRRDQQLAGTWKAGE